jgi:hypothetical protein
MKEDILIVDNFSSLKLNDFPRFIEMANRCGLKNIKEAFDMRCHSFSKGGEDTELKLITNPGLFSEPLKRVLSFFVIALALSQYPKFRYTGDPSGFLGLKIYYLTVVGVKNEASYVLDARAFYKSALRLYTHN